MPTEPYTPAELEAGTEALATHFHRPMLSWCRESTGVVLDAVLPDHDARVRAEVAEQIGKAIEAGLDYGGPETADAARVAVSIARAHATTEGDHHARP